MGGPLAPLFYRRAARDRPRRGPVAVRRRRHAATWTPTTTSRSSGTPIRPSPGRRPAARHPQHPLPIPAPGHRRAGRAAARHDAGRAGHLPVHHVGHRGQRARLADGHCLHRRPRRRHRRARLPRLVGVDGRPQLQRLAGGYRPRASPPSRRRRSGSGTDREEAARRGSLRPPTSSPARARGRRSCWPTASSPARASSTPRRVHRRARRRAATAAGALFLADEVQSGFGRSGPQLWRFALAGITPDLVTLGKPMGAGYPIGAVVTRREIADAFAPRLRVLLHLRGHAGRGRRRPRRARRARGRRGSRASAVRVGEHLRARLARPGRPVSPLSAVRGFGLLAGVDLRAGAHGRPGVHPRRARRPRRHGVLAGSPARAATC